MGGGDVEGGEAVEERGAAEEGRAGADGGGEAGEVARLRRAEEVHLLAGPPAAGALPHRRARPLAGRPASSAAGRGGGGMCGWSRPRRRKGRGGSLRWVALSSGFKSLVAWFSNFLLWINSFIVTC